ncbi:MAG: galactose oxidase-like domain-containing protein [Acidimicrobiia bacterium]
MRGVRGAGLAALLACLAVAGAACGTWEVEPSPAPLNAIHVALLHTGKVLLVAGSGNNKSDFTAGTFKTSIWDPQTKTFQSVSTPWDAFCSGHAFLPDGRLLVAGGTSAFPSAGNANYAGSKHAFIFDPDQSKYVAAPDSTIARWYPTVVELGDGKLFTIGGFDENRTRSRLSEIFDGTQWSAPQAPPAAFPSLPTYPALHLLNDGRLFYSGANVLGTASMVPGIWNIATNDYQTVTGLAKKSLRDEAMSVLLPPAQDQRVLIIGGGKSNGTALATDTTGLVDLKQPQPTYAAGPSLDTPKLYVSAVILPDSTVLETGGASNSVQVGNNPVYSAQIFDPKTNTWSKAATPTVPRVYHSSAILLPDARVATFGGNPNGSYEPRIEIYSPAYLAKGPRPTITSGPVEVSYGANFSIGTTQASALTSAVLVRPAAVTHSSDSNQRLVSLGMTPTANGLSITVPSNHNLTPPGWYMLFVVDNTGVPSVAHWVHVS